MIHLETGGYTSTNALFRNPITYRQVIKPSSICVSARCWPKLRAFSHKDFIFMLPGEA